MAISSSKSASKSLYLLLTDDLMLWTGQSKQKRKQERGIITADIHTHTAKSMGNI